MQIELLDLGPVQIKTVNSGVSHREVRLPGDDISDLPEGIQAQINAHWTEEILENFAVSEPTLAEQKTQALARLADKRYRIETGGITIGGADISTDASAQQKLTAARIVAKENPSYTVKWKADNGFVTLDASTIIAIADAVRTHVQDCFDREAELTILINASEDPLSIDISTGWPS